MRYPKVFVKISHTWSLSRENYPWLDSQRLVKRLYDTFGPQRLMWATDWPIAKDRASYAQRLTVVRDEMKFLNADDKELDAQQNSGTGVADAFKCVIVLPRDKSTTIFRTICRVKSGDLRVCHDSQEPNWGELACRSGG